MIIALNNITNIVKYHKTVTVNCKNDKFYIMYILPQILKVGESRFNFLYFSRFSYNIVLLESDFN